MMLIALALLFAGSCWSSSVVSDAQDPLHTASPDAQSCRCYPGDSCWPTEREWHLLNVTVGGRLVPTVPLASPCHTDDPWATYDRKTCETLRDEWLLPQTHYVSSSSVMAPFFANRSCDPFLAPSYQCVIGTYVQYAINVSTVQDVQAGLKFATEHNIRLIVRNTGHDYNGKSTGSGSLGLWMHHLQDIGLGDWSDEYYTGKAIKMGAGVQGFQAYEAANAVGLQVVGGECATVGLAGGYTQGGGHSALMSRHGLAADQTLEWEVVTATGEYLIANRRNNTDLYWALSGGGGGTFGVVMSLTAKAHPDTPTAGMNLTFTSDNTTQDKYYEAISTFHASLPAIVDAGATSVWYFTNQSFAISPITAPDIPVSQLRTLMKPLIDKLHDLSIPHTTYFGQFPTYLSEFHAMFGPIDVGIAQYGGRLIPRSVVTSNNDALTAAYRSINDHGAQFIGVGCNVSRAVAGDVDNAVNPGWRDALIDSVITTPWSFAPGAWPEMLARQTLMTDVLIPKLAALTPNGSCYLNEGNFLQPNFQSVFYGDNYDRLLAIKNRYDPEHLFYAVTAVGSEYWVERPDDGRLCRADKQ